MLLYPIQGFAYLLLLTTGASASAQEIKLPDAPEPVHVAPPPSDHYPPAGYRIEVQPKP